MADEGSDPNETAPALSKVIPLEEELQQLRLRVLASRKRIVEDSREEGELSESDRTPESPLHDRTNVIESPPPPPPISFGGVSSRPANLLTLSKFPNTVRPNNAHYNRTKRKRDYYKDIGIGRNYDVTNSYLLESRVISPRTEEFLQNLKMEVLPFSETFAPQTCTLVLDSEDEDNNNESESQMTIKETNIQTIQDSSDPFCHFKFTVDEDDDRLHHQELQKQLDLLKNAKDQSRLIIEELKMLTETLAESERMAKTAVEKQKFLKQQLRATKELISASKVQKARNLKRQASLRFEYSQKSKLIFALKNTITPKIDSTANTASTELCAPLALPLPRKVDNSLSSESPVEESKSTLGEGETIPTRSSEMLELEKRALKIKTELVSAQLSLLRNRELQKRKKKTASTKKGLKSGMSSSPKALGKVMGISTFSVAPHGEEQAVATGEEPGASLAEFSKFFTSPLYNVGGHLLEGSVLSELINSMSGLILMKKPRETELQDVTKASTEDENDHDIISDDGAHHFVPYMSPLRAFKTYRYSPYFSFSAPYQGLISRSYTNRILPHRVICSADLMGRCTRRNCQAQHFRTIFMDDSSILEDFMLSLLSMSLGNAFKNENELIVEVKSKLLQMAKEHVPLISLLGVLLDTSKKMNNGFHVVSFRTDVSKEISLFFKQHSKDKPSTIDNKRYLIGGVASLKEGKIPTVSRYFSVESNTEGDNFGTLKDEIGYLETFLLSLKPMQTSSDADKALEILEEGIHVHRNSALLTSLIVDIAPDSSFEDLSCLSWLRKLATLTKSPDLRHNFVKVISSCFEIVKHDTASFGN